MLRNLLSLNMKTVLITGGSGSIGMVLSRNLTQANFEVRHLTRNPNPAKKYKNFKWDIESGELDIKAFENLDYIVHLAGENVSAGRWTSAQKERIRNSRIKSLNLLLNKWPKGQRLSGLISASGISIYGTQTVDQIFSENDDFGDDFLAQVSIEWEKAAAQFSRISDRVAMVRTGIVLEKDSGALSKILQPIKYGIGSPLGSGKQYMPWIHMNDIAGIYQFILEHPEIEGPYNAVADEHVSNATMTQTIADVMRKKLWAPNVPEFALKLLFGEMADIILKGSRIDNTKIKNSGYKFEFPTLKPALKNLI